MPIIDCTGENAHLCTLNRLLLQANIRARKKLYKPQIATCHYKVRKNGEAAADRRAVGMLLRFGADQIFE